MKIGLVSVECKNRDTDYNVNQIKKYMKVSSKKNIDYIFFGESFLHGFDSLNWDYSHDIEIAADKNSEIINFIKKEASILNLGIGFGYFELYEENIYSSYLVISKKGEEIYNYRRISKGWKEDNIIDQHYKEGNEINIFCINDHKFTVALCGDLWDEYTSSLYIDSGVKEIAIIWPVHVDYSLKEWVNELSSYQKRSMIFSDNVYLINNILKPKAHGGAFYFNKSSNEYLNFDAEGILLIEIK